MQAGLGSTCSLVWLASLIFSSTTHSHTKLLGTYNYQKSNHVNMVAINTAIWLVKLMLQKPCRFLSILVLWHTVVYVVGLATPTIIKPLHTSILDSSWASHIPRLHCTQDATSSDLWISESHRSLDLVLKYYIRATQGFVKCLYWW